MSEFDVAIVGAGASGVLVAAHMRREAPSLAVALIDAGARAARGLAYGTPYGAHLLNVPAGGMSAFAGDPEHFARWLSGRTAGASGKGFAPRSLYGEYLADVLAQTCDPPSMVARISGTTVGLTRDGAASWTVHLHDGRTIGARCVVLALGNLPPADPLTFKHDAPKSYLRDPWAPGAAQGLAPDAEILIIGTGLTMIDLVLALRAEGHRGPVHAISRRGLLPQSHAAHLPRPLEPPAGLPSPRSIVRWIRGEIAAAGREGYDWRSVVDGLRPHTQGLWRSWTTAQRASFLRHARVLWDVHRHRSAPEVATQVDALVEDGNLIVHSGRVESIRDVTNGVEVEWVTRRDGQRQLLRVARVINCTGPASNYATLDLPLVVQMRRAGWLLPDPLRLGVETDEQGRLIGTDSHVIPGLFTIGPLRRPSLWESTAIPEIREQALALASLLASEASQRQNRTTA